MNFWTANRTADIKFACKLIRELTYDARYLRGRKYRNRKRLHPNYKSILYSTWRREIPFHEWFAGAFITQAPTRRKLTLVFSQPATTSPPGHYNLPNPKAGLEAGTLSLAS